jgi:hypothetical protein
MCYACNAEGKYVSNILCRPYGTRFFCFPGLTPLRQTQGRLSANLCRRFAAGVWWCYLRALPAKKVPGDLYGLRRVGPPGQEWGGGGWPSLSRMRYRKVKSPTLSPTTREVWGTPDSGLVTHKT